MSYVCTRLMLELNFDESKTYSCLRRIVGDSPTISCLYRLNLEEIRASVEFILDTIAWDNIPSVWLGLKKAHFKPMEYCLIEWMITMFVKNFNLRISGFIFDQFFLSGDIAIYRAAIGIVSLLESQIMTCLHRNADIEEIKEIFANANNSILSIHEFTKAYADVLISEDVQRLMSQLLVPPG